MPETLEEILSDLETSEEVYGPREDSLLLAEAAEDREGERLLELGTGTGFVARAASEGFEQVVAVDVDPSAVELASRNLPEAKVFHSHLFEEVEGEFDLVLFNPPYLPTDEGTEGEAALDGGCEGREVVEGFLDELEGYLSKSGSCLLLVSSLTGREEVAKYASEEGFEVAEVASERQFFEELVVLELTRR